MRHPEGMRTRFLCTLLALALALPGFAPAFCSGTDCPCAPSEPASASPCCPEDAACDACIYCVNCGAQAEAPAVAASATPEWSATRLAPASVAPAVEPVPQGPAVHVPPGPDRTGPASHVSRHIPSVVLRA